MSDERITMDELLEDWHSRALTIDGNDRPTRESTIYVAKLRELCEGALTWHSSIRPEAYRSEDDYTYYNLVRVKE